MILLKASNLISASGAAQAAARQPVLAREIFPLMDGFAAAASAQDIWDAYQAAARRVGLEFGKVFFADAGVDSGALPASMPADWLAQYASQSLAEGDLVLDRARQNPRSFAWHFSDWEDGGLTPMQRHWRAHCLHHSLKGGLCITGLRKDEHLVIVLYGGGEPIHAHDAMALVCAGHEVLSCLNELGLGSPVAVQRLSARECEVLRWAAAGKTDWEIGQILSISAKTANAYVERAKTKLRASTRAQAVMVAVQAGLIEAGPAPEAAPPNALG